MKKKTKCLVAILGILIVIVTLFYLIRAQMEKGPEIKEFTILHPTYATSIGELSAGTLFLTTIKGYDNIVAITALHIFGPKGGLNRQYQTPELKNLIQDVSFIDAFDQKQLQLKLDPISFNGPKFQNGSTKRDVAAFLVKGDRKLPTLRFSTVKPKVGDKVWLITSVAKGDPPDQKAHEARVVSALGSELRIRYENQELAFSGTSGSPVINQDGEVIGVHVGSVKEKDGLIGYSFSGIDVMNMIKKALKLDLR